jgi:hypothetical protein
MIVGGEPRSTDSARIALGRFVQLSCRFSHDASIHGPAPTDENEAVEFFARNSGVFSKRGSLPQLDRDGVFFLTRFTVQVSDLLSGIFYGFAPRELADYVGYRTTGRVTGPTYPPVGV